MNYVGRYQVRPARSLYDAFDPRANGLNLFRLIFAAGVVFWHSFAVTGATLDIPGIHQLVAEVWVDGFFAVSGFLIASSWSRRPQVLPFVRARLLRILPGYYVCLAVTALLVAPMGVWISGGDGWSLVRSGASWEYIWKNAAVWAFQFDVGGTPVGVPYPHVWNASLWTLGWEVLCYGAILILGIMKSIKASWVVPAVFAFAWLLLLAYCLGATTSESVHLAGRFGSVFFAGVLIFVFSRVIPVRPVLICVAGLLVLSSSLLPDYRLLAAPALAYFILASATYVRSRQLQLKTDLSYGAYVYAFPVQQLLASAGVATIGVVPFALFSIAATMPIAYASYVFVEKPFLRLKTRTCSPPAANNEIS